MRREERRCLRDVRADIQGLQTSNRSGKHHSVEKLAATENAFHHHEFLTVLEVIAAAKGEVYFP
jgi:hypothetical protein